MLAVGGDGIAIRSIVLQAGADIYPYQVCAFQGHHLPTGDMLCDKIAKHSIVSPEVFVELVYPVFTIVVGGDECQRTEGIDVAHLVDVDGAIDTATHGGIAADDVGNLKTCSIERLRRRVKDDGIGIDGAHRAERVTWHDEFAVYLVADDGNMMTTTDVAHALQFLTTPDAPRGVMRVTQHEGGSLLVSTALLEVLPIDLEAACNRLLVGVTGIAAAEPQHTLEDLTAVVANGGEEAVVVGRQHEHLLAGHGERLDGTRQGRYDTSSI